MYNPDTIYVWEPLDHLVHHGIHICSWQMYRNALCVRTLYLAFIMSQDDWAFSGFLRRWFLAGR